MTTQRGRKSASALATSFVPVDGRSPPLRPPPSLSDRERDIWVHVVTAARDGHFKSGDEALLSRFCEVSAACDVAAAKFRIDLAKGRMPSPWLTTVERLQKLLIPLCRQLKLSPLSRSPNKSGHPVSVDLHGGNGHISVYETMRLADDPQ
jgi:phage terminase small subunit